MPLRDVDRVDTVRRSRSFAFSARGGSVWQPRATNTLADRHACQNRRQQTDIVRFSSKSICKYLPVISARRIRLSSGLSC